MSWQVKIIQQCHVVAQTIVAQVLVEIFFVSFQGKMESDFIFSALSRK